MTQIAEESVCATWVGDAARTVLDDADQWVQNKREGTIDHFILHGIEEGPPQKAQRSIATDVSVRMKYLAVDSQARGDMKVVPGEDMRELMRMPRKLTGLRNDARLDEKP